MKSYIALNYLTPKHEMMDFPHKIPKGEVWIRDDIYDNQWKFESTKEHELLEIHLMQCGYRYRPAHAVAELENFGWY